jgi:hypothetical protein
MTAWLLRVVRITAAVAAVVTAVACGHESPSPVGPSTAGCQGGGSFTTSGFGGVIVWGFEVDRRNLADGVNIRVGERVRIPINVKRPTVTRSCGPTPVFTYMLWSWNYTDPSTGRNPSGDTMPLIPRPAPIDVTMAVCRCRLFGDPYWAVPTTGGVSHWEQRAWLDGEQTLELEVQGISPGSTSLFVTGFVGSPYPTTNPVGDHTIYQFHLLRASVVP